MFDMCCLLYIYIQYTRSIADVWYVLFAIYIYSTEWCCCVFQRRLRLVRRLPVGLSGSCVRSSSCCLYCLSSVWSGETAAENTQVRKHTYKIPIKIPESENTLIKYPSQKIPIKIPGQKTHLWNTRSENTLIKYPSKYPVRKHTYKIPESENTLMKYPVRKHTYKIPESENTLMKYPSKYPVRKHTYKIPIKIPGQKTHL